MAKTNKGRKLFATTATAALVASAIVPVASAAEFTDANQIASYAKEAVEYLADNGIIEGTTTGAFNPKGNINRAEAATIFTKALDLDTTGSEEFSDVAPGQWWYEAVVGAYNAGIVQGKGAGKFEPKANLTRAEAAKMLVEAYGFEGEADLSEFTDYNSAVAGKWSEEYLAAAVENEIINGKDGKLAPNDSITRQEFATMFYRAINAAVEVDYAADLTAALAAIPAEITKENVEAAQKAVDAATAALAAAVKAEAITEEEAKEAQAKIDAAQAKIDAVVVSNLDTANVKITAKSGTLVANGADNTVITFEIIGENGKVDTGANDIVLEIGTSFGNLANNRLTVQNGTASVVLTSEFSAVDLTAKITARVIETVSDKYKDQIGKKAAEAEVKFVASGASTDLNTVTLVDAESNQADRVTLYFDKAVTVDAFVKTVEKTNTDGTKYTEFATKTVGTEVVQDLKVNIEVIQEGETKVRQVKGIKAVAGNPKAVEVLLVKDDALTDNKRITVDAKIGTTTNKKSFILTDARQPEFTSVTPTSLRTADLRFSEAVVKGNFTIDGLWDAADVTNLVKDSNEYKAAIAGKEFTISFGDFNAAKGTDNRHTATLETLPYAEGTQGAVTAAQATATNKVNIGKHRYFTAGNHSITVNQLRDFAGLTDAANVSSSQTLSFNILANTAAPTATVTVESPEQFRVKFNTDVDFDFNAAEVNSLEAYFAKYFTSTKTDFKLTAADLVVTTIEADEYVVELTKDWTKLLDASTDITNVYYNYKHGFRFAKETIYNVANGAINAEIAISLNEVGSPLNGPDNVSPVIADILKGSDDSKYQVVMSEPVKLPKDGDALNSKDNAGSTLAVGQTSLPIVTAEFQGTDKNGKAVVIPAVVDGYLGTNGSDKVFQVRTAEAQALQKLVDAGYGVNWKVVVRSISDDIGNTASTVTKDFVVAPTVTSAGKFQIVSPENGLGNEVIVYDYDNYVLNGIRQADKIEITFTKGVVHTGGLSDLTQVNNWTLNGKQLTNVASIVVQDTDNNTANGYEKVVITFTDDTAVTNTNISNVVAVNKNIVSKDGTALTGEYEVVAFTSRNGTLPPAPEKTDLEKAKDALTADINTAKATSVTGKTAESVKALEDAIKAAEAVLVKANVTEADLKAESEKVKAAVAGLKDEVKAPETGEKTLTEAELLVEGKKAEVLAPVAGLVTVTIDPADLKEDYKAKTITVVIDGVKYPTTTRNGKLVAAFESPLTTAEVAAKATFIAE